MCKATSRLGAPSSAAEKVGMFCTLHPRAVQSLHYRHDREINTSPATAHTVQTPTQTHTAPTRRRRTLVNSCFSMHTASSTDIHACTQMSAVWFDYTYMMRTQTSAHPHSHTQTSTRQHVASAHLSRPPSQSTLWFSLELGAKIRTSELKIHYGSIGGV